MTSIARTPDLDVLLALCCECGTTRTVSRRASGCGGNRPLRCETCRKTTPHAAIGADPFDWREDLNHEKKPTLSAADQLDVLRSMGVDVRDADASTTVSGKGIIVTLYWYLDEDGGFLVEVHPGFSEEERKSALTHVLEKVAAPEDHQWHVQHWEDGPVAISAYVLT